MSAFEEIRAALESQIGNVTGIPSAENRAWENTMFEPTTGTPWVRMTLIPGLSRKSANGSSAEIRYDGIFQIDVFVPSGNGPNEADTIADNIRELFEPGAAFTYGSTAVRINHSERNAGTVDGPWYFVSVIVSWFTYRS